MTKEKKRLIIDSPLVIYKASAGSGKTYTLTLYYLWLLFKSYDTTALSERNRSYRRILAVTFTNKATGEMKARIVKSLFELSVGAGDENYIDELISIGCVKDKDDLQTKAKEILYTLLHDYANFNVSTIDTFFQRTMRAFVRDMGMQGGYNVELDSEMIADEAIDRMYASLSDEGEDNSLLKDWLLEYDKRQIEDGKNWNSAERAIRELSKQLFRDDYKRSLDNVKKEDLPTKKEIADFYNILTAEIKKFREDFFKIIKEGNEVLKGIAVEELAGKSKTPLNYFISPSSKIAPPAAKLAQSVDDDMFPDNLLQKKGVSSETKAKIDAFAQGGYIQSINNLFELRHSQYCMNMILRTHLYSFGILRDIDNHVRDIVKERNLMLLSDTTDLLSKIIKDTDTPFIYEKTGVNIHHFMIDEFQDTSLSQWKNFMPLLKESISNSGNNLIVGDVKQSIYRWRNSDWRTLNELPSNPAYFADNGAISKHLEVNWRSAPNVVTFNNVFFEKAVEVLAGSKVDERGSNFTEKLSLAYSEHKQIINPNKQPNTGYVKVDFIKPSEGATFEECALEQLYNDIEHIIETGGRVEDMAILVRTNDEAADIARYLMRNQLTSKSKYYVLSDEAMLVKSSPIVRAIIAIMHYINAPEDAVNRLMVNYECSLIKENEPDSIMQVLSTIGSDNAKLERYVKLLASKPLYEMSEEIIRLLDVGGDLSQLPYIQAFQDLLLSYVAQHGSLLSAFLEWWDIKSDKFAISTPESSDAIRIMTIHKAKGLEYHTLFIPFCNWEMEKGADVLWRKPLIEGKDSWIIPLTVSKSMLNTDYADDFKEEKTMAVIDNFNLAYVAFTRAKDNLIIYTPEPSANSLSSMSNFNALLFNTVNLLPFDKSFFSDGCFEMGSLCVKESSVSKNSNMVKIPKYEVASGNSKLRLKLKGASYFDSRSNRSLGEIKHEMMSEIILVSDVERISNKYEKMGIISSKEAAEFKNLILRQIENNPRIASWFASGVQVLNETNVLNSDRLSGLLKRPDRVIISGDKVVVVDYKFGEESNKYKSQIKDYIGLLKGMGYINVEGFIWYVNKGIVV